MNSKHMMTMACAVALCGSVLADTNETVNAEVAAGWNWAMGEGVAFEETPIVSAEVSLAFDSKFLSYGLVDNNDPILTPAAALTFCDWVTFGVESIFDISHYGKDAGYGDRAWRYQEIDPGVAFSHAFGSEDAEWLPTTVEFEFGYIYEAHPKVVDDDTQFFSFAIGLPDIWIEPVFAYELDLERDHGTYLNLELGHTFTLIGPSEEGGDDVLDFRLSAAQGWGDKKRISAYLPDIHRIDEDGEFGELEHAGLMDTCIKGEFTWTITDGVSLGAYVAYTDYLFDSSTREASRHYEATGAWDKSWNFVAGVSLAVVF